MKIKEIHDLPLRELFEQLRDAGFVLGVDEYELLLKSLMAGFGLPDRKALARLCKMLWVKSVEECLIFDEYFQKFIDEEPVQSLVTFEEPEPEKREEVTVSKPLHQERESVQELPKDGPIPESSVPTPVVDTQPKDEEAQVETVEEPEFFADKTLQIGDEVQVFKAQQHHRIRFLLQSDYLPITARQMKQTWRTLRRPMREGPPVELDVEGTIKKVSREKFLLNPVLVPARVNRSQLVLLLDVDGSMVAFHSLGNRVKETAIRGGRLGRSQVYYFHNCPIEHVYGDRPFINAIPFESLLSQLSPRHSGLLIFSDAGAARGGYSQERLEWTDIFLRAFQERLRYQVWVNPVPQERWQGTTAEEIGKLIPMVECGRSGLQQAVKVLRGKR